MATKNINVKFAVISTKETKLRMYALYVQPLLQILKRSNQKRKVV